MTSGPRLIPLDSRLIPGLLALGLFGIMTAVFLTADEAVISGGPGTFADTNVVEAIGYALIGAAERGVEETENFLVALIMIAVLLDAALDGSLMLAKRDDGGDE